MKILSLFDGISCGRIALERAGIPVDRYIAYEIDEYAIKVSSKNYPDIEHKGTVENADFSQFLGFDIVMGGFPCQDLSINKANRQGLNGKRSGLFWELVRALKEVQPKYFLVENNYKMPVNALDVITQTLGVEPILIDSKLLSAQKRQRLYWTNIPHVKQPKNKNIVVADILEDVTNETNLFDLTKFNGRETLKECQQELLRVGSIGRGGARRTCLFNLWKINKFNCKWWWQRCKNWLVFDQ